jgi:chloramphenicol O-acetyltransferase type A
MRAIKFDNDHRQKHFDFFRRMDQPHFGITAEVDITGFLDHVRKSPTLRFTPAMVYLIGRAAMEVRPFRWRLRGDEVVEHDVLRPSFAVPTSGSDVFSFCTVTWQEDPVAFHVHADAKIEEMKHNPSFEDEAGADNYLFLSSFPWASFTSVTHAMHYSPGDSVPRITWGKYFKRDGKVLMPLAVQAHHALVDGRDLGEYYRKMEAILQKTEEIFIDFEKK